MSAKVREMVLPAVTRHGPLKPGSSMIRLFPSRVGTRSECSINIADSLAKRRTVRWRYLSLPITRQLAVGYSAVSAQGLDDG